MSAGTKNDLSTTHVIVRVFGGMGVDVYGEPISIGGPRQRRLLALLASRAGSVVDIDWLAEYLWDDDDRPEATAPALRTYVSRLRQALPESAQSWLETEPSGYRFSPPDDSVEHRRFARLRAEATRARELEDPQAALALLDEALTLWRGEPFRELEDLDWARVEVEKLRLDRLEVLEERWECALALGRHTQITGELATFTAEHRLRERAVRQHALALHRSGRTTEALRVIDDHRRILVEESGLEPSAAIGELEAALLAGDPSLDIEKVGRPLRGYRLLEEIGSGAFSVVWKAIQPSVDREVAIKQIRSELASQPEFIRRFEAEAHLVARIEHPHIVPLIDYWRDPDSAYLVMRWLGGGTLERLLDDGPLTIDQTRAIAHQIGGALMAAHSHGVVHRDVKPANIMCDDAGNAFLGDFGIALDVAESSGPEAALSPGSPAYASPEQIRQQRLGPGADVFSLGVVLFECLTGALPFSASSNADLIDLQLHTPYPSLSELRSDVPQPVADAVARATEKAPDNRFESIADFLEALDVAAPSTNTGSPGGIRPSEGGDAQITNPYKGLQAFGDGDADQFFGRDSLVAELSDRFAGSSTTARCVVVVGPSGSGKSSVVKAGLTPALRAGTAPGASDWFATTMVPGQDPYEALEAALLRIAVNPPTSLLDQLRDGRRGILRSVRRCIESDDHRVLVTIDQFEEVFTGPDAENTYSFLEALAAAIDDPTSPLRLIITLRADYYDQPLSHPTFAPIVKACSVDVTPLAPNELEEAIVEPARRLGVEFEPGLVARIAAETMGQRAPLPLLQYTLSELFDRRSGTELTVSAYEEIGGLAGALSARADSLYAAADDPQRAAIRRLFGQLTNPGEESADLRRRVRLADLGSDQQMAWVLDRFGAARLLTFDRDVGSREPTVEVAHEALLREWPRLVGWLQDDGELLRSVDTVAVAANTWVDGARQSADLIRGGRLEGAVALLLKAPDRLRLVDTEFIGAAKAAAESERKAERAQVSRLRRLVGAVGVALVVAIIAGVLALVAQRRADDEADTALAAVETADLATLISRSAAQSSEDPDVALLLALEAHRRSPVPETEQAILNALGSSSVATRVVSLDPPSDPTSSCPLAAAASDGLTEFAVRDATLTSRDVSTGEVTDHGPVPDDVDCVIWMGDETLNRRWAGSEDARTMWFGPFDGPWEIKREFDDPTFRVKWAHTPANRIVAITEASSGPALTLIDEVTGETVGTPLNFGDDLLGIEANDDGSLVAVGFAVRGGADGDGHTFILDGRTGEEIHHVVSKLPAARIVFDDSRNELVAAIVDGSLMTVDIASGEIVAAVETTTPSALLDLGVQPDGTIMVVSEGQIEFVDRQAGPTGPTFELRNVVGARIRPDNLITTFTADDRTNLVDLSVGNALVDKSWSIPLTANVTIVEGRAGVVTGPSSDIEVIELESGDRRQSQLTDVDGSPLLASFINPDPDGFWAFTAVSREMVRFKDDEPVQRFDVPGDAGNGPAIGDKWGFTLELTGEPTVATLLSMDRDNPGILLSIPAPDASTAYPLPDGGLVVMDDDGELRQYDSEGEPRFEHDTAVEGALLLSVDAASGRIAMSSQGGGLTVLDPSTGTQESFPISDRFGGLSFVRNGEFLLLTSGDGTVRLWDVERGASAGVVWDGSGATFGTESWYDAQTDSVWVATSSLLVRIPLNPEQWVERACEIVGRNLTDDEWERLVPGDDPPQSACD